MTPQHSEQPEVKVHVYPSISIPDCLEIEFTIVGGDEAARDLTEKKVQKIMAELERELAPLPATWSENSSRPSPSHSERANV
jgi:hypothetical protein